MATRDLAANNLATRLLSRPWTEEAIALEIKMALESTHGRTRRALVARLFALGSGAYPPSPHALTAFLISSPYFKPPQRSAAAAVLDSPMFAPAAPFIGLPIPALVTLGELAEWVGLSLDQLDGLAGVRQGHSRTVEPTLQHYRYGFIDKSGGKSRLIEAPKPRLKAIQRQILREILAPVPVHPCAKGFVAGRSCMSGAQVHASEAVVATFDLAQFFPSISLARIHGIFRCFGYPWIVSRRLAGLCTTTTPPGIFRRIPEVRRPDTHEQALFRVPHLPQGAPTSPALANLPAYKVDLRLHGLARAAGANYTRYADDLAFSGDAGFADALDRFGISIERILKEEGFALNPTKTRIMSRGQRQRVTGIVVNEHCNVGRAEFDALKAILFNSARSGPAGQNRAGAPDFRAHLAGRVSWVEQVNPARGAKLRQLFDQIEWATSV